jgi:hypothetical protein
VAKRPAFPQPPEDDMNKMSVFGHFFHKINTQTKKWEGCMHDSILNVRILLIYFFFTHIRAQPSEMMAKNQMMN